MVFMNVHRVLLHHTGTDIARGAARHERHAPRADGGKVGRLFDYMGKVAGFAVSTCEKEIINKT